VEVSGPPVEARLYRADSTGSWVLRATQPPAASRQWVFLDRGLVPQTTYAYRLGMANCGVESFSTVAHVRVPQVPPSGRALAVRSLGPNPASRSLSAAITLVDRGPATLALLDLAGRVVRRQEVMTPGPGDYTLV